MNEKTISCCNSCDEPVVWTFAFRGAEYYCLMCGRATGMLGGITELPYTTELRARQIIIERVWNALRKDFIGSGGYTKSNCKKCEKATGGYHTDHLTDLEKAKDKVIREFLDLINKDTTKD